MFGITDEGFQAKRLEDFVIELTEEYEAELGNVDTSPESVLGVQIGIQAKAFADLWEGYQALYASFYPDSASGIPLDNVLSLTGLKRLDATKSTGTIQATGVNGTAIAAARVVSVTGTGDRFETSAAGTISAAACVTSIIEITTVTDSIDYTATINGEAHTFNSGVSATAQSIVTGLIAAIVGGAQPVTPSDNGDETITVLADDLTVSFAITLTAEMDFGDITSNIPVISEEFGPIAGLSGTIVTIETPVSGWDSVNNAFDMVLGRDDETDTNARLRRSESLQVSGAGTIEAIKARLLQVDNVTGALVEENITLITDGSGRPGKSFEAIVAGGDDQDIADLIWEVKPAGIEPHGTESVLVTDSMGIDHTIKFSRATEIFTWIKVTVTKYTEEDYPTDGDDQISASVLAHGNTLEIGIDVLLQRFLGGIHETPGIASALVEVATSATAGGPPGAYGTVDLAISNTEVSVFDSTRITVIS